jgi:chromosome segregation ATPase
MVGVRKLVLSTRCVLSWRVVKDFQVTPNFVRMQCFSSIVGPNGSGKSNVIDSLLFVFGFKAKSLRQDKVRDLIHKSDTYPDLQYCKVGIYFVEAIDKVLVSFLCGGAFY